MLEEDLANLIYAEPDIDELLEELLCENIDEDEDINKIKQALPETLYHLLPRKDKLSAYKVLYGEEGMEKLLLEYKKIGDLLGGIYEDTLVENNREGCQMNLNANKVNTKARKR